ncbi:MAG: hypothetical protein IJW82_08075 [Clostridia bacterium]|nr:hypothetical protein [Clostridia bacterium]
MENKFNAKDLEKLKLLITIVNRGKGGFFVDLLENFSINFQCQLLGHGTADSEILDVLGLATQQKDIVLSIVKEEESKKIMDTLNEKFSTVKNGNGIAFTIPVKSVVGVYLYQFLSDTRVKRS